MIQISGKKIVIERVEVGDDECSFPGISFTTDGSFDENGKDRQGTFAVFFSDEALKKMGGDEITLVIQDDTDTHGVAFSLGTSEYVDDTRSVMLPFIENEIDEATAKENWVVKGWEKSDSTLGIRYLVEQNNVTKTWRCSCPAFKYRPFESCKHIRRIQFGR